MVIKFKFKEEIKKGEREKKLATTKEWLCLSRQSEALVIPLKFT